MQIAIVSNKLIIAYQDEIVNLVMRFFI